MRYTPSLVGVVLLTTAAWAQPPGGVVNGKITAVEAKGKTTSLTVQDDAGTEHRFDVTPRVAFEIQSTGDEACLAPGLFVQVEAIQSNQAYFGSVFSIYPDRVGKLPPAKAVKAPPKQGESTRRFFVSGEIARFEKVEDAKYNLLHLKLNPKAELPIYIEPDHRIHVVQTDPQSAVVGQTVTVEGRTAGSKLLPTKITIDTGETLNGEEFLANRKAKK